MSDKPKKISVIITRNVFIDGDYKAIGESHTFAEKDEATAKYLLGCGKVALTDSKEAKLAKNQANTKVKTTINQLDKFTGMTVKALQAFLKNLDIEFEPKARVDELREIARKAEISNEGAENTSNNPDGK